MPGISIHRRVYYDDTDSGGVVYHTHYLRYMEHARTDYLHERGIAPPVLEQRYGIIFVVAGMNIRYLAPARLGDELVVEAVLHKHGRAAVQFKQAAWLSVDGRRERELVRADVDVVCIDSKSFKPVRIPESVRETITSER